MNADERRFREKNPRLSASIRDSKNPAPLPDRLIAADILARVPERRWIREVLVFESATSTNDLVAKLAREGAPPGVAIFAEEQTAGRGRLGRRWQSDPGLGLWFSILLRPAMPVVEWPRLTLWLAFAVAQGVRNSTGVELGLKWPNDLHASGRKLAGILVETSLGENAFAIAGIGLNVNHTAFPAPLDATATSLRIETGAPLDRNALAAAIVASIDRSFSLLPSHFKQIIAWATRADCLRGRTVTATAGAVAHEGIAQGIDAEGALLIRATDGALARVTSGEVTGFSAAGG